MRYSWSVITYRNAFREKIGSHGISEVRGLVNHNLSRSRAFSEKEAPTVDSQLHRGTRTPSRRIPVRRWAKWREKHEDEPGKGVPVAAPQTALMLL